MNPKRFQDVCSDLGTGSFAHRNFKKVFRWVLGFENRCICTGVTQPGAATLRDSLKPHLIRAQKSPGRAGAFQITSGLAEISTSERLHPN
jgi:hypothetical protein